MRKLLLPYIIVAFLLLVACGNKGGLYLPPQQSELQEMIFIDSSDV